MGTLTFTAGEGTVQSTFTTGVTSTALTFGSLAARPVGADGLFIASGGANGTTNKIVLTGVTPGATGIVLGSGVAGAGGQAVYFFDTVNPSTTGTPADFAVYDTGGFVRAINYGTDTTLAATVAAAGTLTASRVNQITTGSGTTGAVTQTAAAIVNGIKFANGTTSLATGSNLVTTPSILVAGGGTATISGATGITTGGSGDLVIRTDTAADSLTISSPITSSTTGGLTKTGAGKLTLTGTNAFTGNINIDGGILSITGPGGTTDPTALGAAGARNVTLNGGTFQITGGGYNPGAGTKVFVIGPAGGTFDVSNQTFVLDDTPTQLTGSGNLTLGGTTTSAGVLQTGNATASTFTGNVFVNAGTLRLINGANALGNTAGQVVVVASGAALDLNIATVPQNVVLNGTGTAGGGALLDSSATAGGLSGAITLASNSAIGVSSTASLTLSGSITDNGVGFSLTKVGAGTGNLILNGASTYTGGTILSAGAILIGNNAALGTGPLTVSGTGTTVAANGTASFVTTNGVILNADAVLGSATNSGALTFGSLNLGGGAPRTITVNNPGANAITFAGPITNGALTLAGPGTLVLPGAGSYAGATIVNAGGTLSVGSTTLANTTALTIGAAASSSLNFFADNAGVAENLAPNATATFGGATSQARLGFQLGDTSNYDSLNVTGAAGGVTVAAGGAPISITALAGFGIGNYNLITASGGATITGASNFSLQTAALPTGYHYALATSATAVTLTVTGGAGGNLYWAGGINNSWNGGAGGPATNWSTDAAGSNISAFAPNASNTVVFSASSIGAATPVATALDQNFSVAGIVVNNSSTGAVTINQGAFGTLTLGVGGINIQTGGPASTTINAPLALSAVEPWTIADSGQTLNVLTGGLANSVISGPGGIALAGTGTLGLGGFSTFTGGVTTSATGTLNLNNGGSTTTNSALGTGTFVISGGTIDNTSGVSQAIQTVNAQNWNGDFTFLGSNSLSLGTGAVALGGSRQVTVNANTLVAGGVISGAFSLTKAGAGALTLSGANTFGGSGNTVTLAAGTLNINAAAALGNAANKLIVNGGTLDNTSSAAVTTGNYPMTWNSSFTFGGSNGLNLGTGATALTVSPTITTNSQLFGLAGVNADALAVGGVISGNFSLTKAGPGELILNGANTFGGAGQSVTLGAGVLGFGNAAALGNASNTLIISASGTIPLALDATAAVTLGAYGQSWNSDFAFIGTAALNSTGTVTLGGNTTVTLLSGTNALSVGGVIGGAAGVGLTLNGPGVFDIYNADSYTGATTINPGSIVNLGSNNGTAGAAGGLSSNTLVLNGGTLNYVRTGAVSQSFAGGTTIGPGAALVTESVAASQSLNLGTITRQAGGTVNFTLTGTPAGLTGITTSTPNTAGILGGWATIASGANWAVANGATSTITAYAGYTPSVAVTTAPGSAANVDFQVNNTTPWSTQSINTLRFGQNAADTLTLGSGQVLTIAAGGILDTPTVAGNASTITGGTIVSGAGDLIVNQFNTTGALNLNTVVDGTGGLTKSGTATGATVLGGSLNSGLGGTITNTLSGGIWINAGVLQANGTDVAGGNGSTGALGSNAITMNGGTLALAMDGDATGTRNAVTLGNDVSFNASATINVTRLAQGINLGGPATLFQTAANKIVKLGALTVVNPGTTVTITPASGTGYGIEFTAASNIFSQPYTTLSVGANYGTVATNQLPSLILSGPVTGTQSWTKAGTGEMLLTNTDNAGSLSGNILVNAGMLAFLADATLNDAALGAPGNRITLNGGTLEAVGAIVTGYNTAPIAITSSRTIDFFTASSIGVGGSTTLTLLSPFGPTNAGFSKTDLGTLVLAANNDAWSGNVTITAGALELTNSGALGLNTGATKLTVSNNVGAALQLANNVSIFDGITLSGTVGINSAGAIESLSGSNILNGLITLGTAASDIGADAGTLTLRGGITGAQGLTFVGAGNINLDTAAVGAVSSIAKMGGGTTTLGVASPLFVGALTVNAGTFYLGGPTGAGAGSVGPSGTVTINPGATLTVDDSVGIPVANRLGGNRPMTLQGGAFNYIGSAGGSSSELLGSLTPGVGNGVITITAGSGGQANVQVASIGTVAAGSTLLIRGSNLGSAVGSDVATLSSVAGATFVGNQGLTATVNKGILPWAIVDTTTTGLGSSFLTLDNTVAATGTPGALFRPLNSNEYVTSLFYGAVANTVLGSTNALEGSLSVNSLTLNSGGGVTLNPMLQLVLGATTGASGASGGLLAQDGNTGLSGGILMLNALALYAYTPTATPANTTTIGSVIAGSAGINKAGNGTLALTSFEPYTGTTTVNQGTLRLAAGTNTIVVGLNTTGASAVVNPGGTLDLHGNVQVVGALSSTGAAINGGQLGGTVTSSTGTGTIVSTAASSFAGNIDGAVNFIHSGGLMTLLKPQGYTGTTLINGGGLSSANALAGVTLTDNGSLASTDITLNFASLNLNNSSGTLTDSSSRLPANVAITMNGGGFNLYGRAASYSNQTVGSINAQSGINVISAASQSNGGTGPDSAALTITSLSRNAASGATVIFAQNYQNNSAGSLGLISDGNGHSENIIATNWSSTSPLTNNIIGGWALIDPGYFPFTPVEFASYNPTLGVGALNTAGFAGYDATAMSASSQPGQNIRYNATATNTLVATVPLNGLTINTLNLTTSINSATSQSGTGVSMTFAGASDLLTLSSGGMIVNIMQNNATATISNTMTGTIGATANSGRITSAYDNGNGADDLYFFYQNSTATAANALTINSDFVDDGSTPVRLVFTGGNFGNASNIILQGTNLYSGGTVVNGTTVTVGATGTLPGGGLTLNGGVVTQAAGGVIASQAITINGGSTLTFAGTNNNFTSAITFNNFGGTAPTLAAGTLLNLAGASSITASSNNVAAVNTFSGTALDISGVDNGNGAGVFTITANAVTADGTAGGTVISPYTATLNISAIIQSTTTAGVPGALIKEGNGILQLGGANTFTGGVTLNAGGLYITAAQGLGLTTSGPGGFLTIAGNNTSISGSAATAVNPIVWGSSATNVTIGQYGGAALVLSGNETWGTGITRTLTTNAVAGATFSAQTLSGVFIGSGGLAKQGLGLLAITNANSAGSFDLTGANAVEIDNGTLQIGADASLGFAPGPVVSNNITLDGGVLSASATTTLNPNRGIQLSGTNTSGILDTTTGTFTIAGVIGGSNGLVKTGAGTLLLAGGNTYTGQTVISGAAGLTAANFFALGTTDAGTVVLNTSALNLDNTVPGGAIIIGAEALELNGTGVSSAGALANIAGPNTYGGNVTLDSASSIGSTAGLLTLNGPLASSNPTSAPLSALTLVGAGFLQVNGAIGSSISTLTKSGTGTDYLFGANAYTGITTISAGALRLQNNNGLGATTAGTSVAAGAALELDGSSTNGALSVGAEPLTLNGAGIAASSGIAASPGALRNVVGNNSFAGAITLGSASQIDSDFGSLTLTGGITGSFGLTIGGAGNTTISTAGLSGITSLTKTDVGTLTLAVANAYSGATAVNNGVLNVQAAGGRWGLRRESPSPPGRLCNWEPAWGTFRSRLAGPAHSPDKMARWSMSAVPTPTPVRSPWPWMPRFRWMPAA